MNTYCRGYLVEEIRAFPAAGQALADLAPADVVYLFDDHTLRRDPLVTKGSVLIAADTPGWVPFCLDQLGFEVPDFVNTGTHVSD